MHETKFVNEVITVLRQKLGTNIIPGQIVVNVRLSPFSHVAFENLQESFKELGGGKNYKNLRLNILPLKVLLECKNCQRSIQISKRIFDCPFCNSSDVNLQADKDFFVESIEIEHK